MTENNDKTNEWDYQTGGLKMKWVKNRTKIGNILLITSSITVVAIMTLHMITCCPMIYSDSWITVEINYGIGRVSETITFSQTEFYPGSGVLFKLNQTRAGNYSIYTDDCQPICDNLRFIKNLTASENDMFYEFIKVDYGTNIWITYEGLLVAKIEFK